MRSRYDGMDCIKTGFVNASGFNLAGTAWGNPPAPDRRGARRPDVQPSRQPGRSFARPRLRRRSAAANVATIEVAAAVPADGVPRSRRQHNPRSGSRCRSRVAEQPKAVAKTTDAALKAGSRDDPDRRLQEPEGRRGRAGRGPSNIIPGTVEGCGKQRNGVFPSRA